MNNIEVHKFLQDHNFTKSCVRPPAIGEENEVTSVDRMSTHSSVSGKSEVSTATPRRTDIDLGFEPEGSASPLPMCDGWWSALPCVLEDSEGLRLFRAFLADSEQAELLNGWLACKGFRESGTKNSNSNNSSAASSTTGPLTAQRTQMDIATLQTRGKLARKIFNTYLRKDKSKACTLVSSAIEDVTRQHICKQIKNAFQSQKSTSSFFELDVNLFDQAQKEIEDYIEKNCYHSFLNSEILQKYAAKCESNKKQPSQVLAAQTQNENKNAPSSVSQVPPLAEAAAVTGHYPYLPRLVEDQIWHPPMRPKSDTISTDKDQSLNSTISSGVSQSSLAKKAMKRNMAASHAQYPNLPDGPDQNHPAYAYLVAPSANKYYVPPASANASDNASSDATSDTLSITDGSIDLEPYNSKKSQKRLIRHHTKRNPNMYCPAEDHFISLTRRCNYKQNLATLATDNPEEFFAQLKEKLDRVLEERKRKEIMEAAAMDNIEDILDSHIERVGHMKTPNPIESPNRNQSPPPVIPSSRNSAQTLIKSQSIPPNIPTSRPTMDERTLRLQQKSLPNHSAVAQHRPENFDHAAMMQRSSLRRRKETAVGMAPNEVPDVTEVPAPPVDKNSFIKEWIKQQDKPATPRNSGPQPRRGAGRPSQFINPSDSFPSQATVTSKAIPYRPQPLQPISQDTSMPLLSNPDPNTMLEEVKRRLIEETEEKCHITDSMRGLGGAVTQQNAFVNPAQFAGLPSTPATSSSSHRMDLRHGALSYNQIPASAPSSGIGTASSFDGHSDASHLGAKSSTSKTTCFYYMQNEEFPYKIQIPHSSVTLGQFKQYIRRKGNYAYYFKQYSKEIGEPVYFQIVKDNEVLPLWENAVVAKVEIASS